MVKAIRFLLSKVDNFEKLLAQYKYECVRFVNQKSEQPNANNQSSAVLIVDGPEPIVIHIYFYGQTRDIL